MQQREMMTSQGCRRSLLLSSISHSTVTGLPHSICDVVECVGQPNQFTARGRLNTNGTGCRQRLLPSAARADQASRVVLPGSGMCYMVQIRYLFDRKI